MVIDVIDFNITDIIRGEDHVTNTAIQIEMFASLATAAPNFGHLSLIKARGGLKSLVFVMKQALKQWLSMVFLSNVYNTMSDLIKEFDLNIFSKSPQAFKP